MVAGFDLPPGGRRLHEGDNAFTVGFEPSFLPPCFSVFHLWDRLFVAGYRVRRQPFDDGSQRHAAHARRRRHRHRLARQLTRHVPLAARRWRRRRKTHKGKTLKPNEFFKRKESLGWLRGRIFLQLHPLHVRLGTISSKFCCFCTYTVSFFVFFQFFSLLTANFFFPRREGGWLQWPFATRPIRAPIAIDVGEGGGGLDSTGSLIIRPSFNWSTPNAFR